MMDASQSKKDAGRAKPLVHVLVCLFGVTSWSIMNGLWVELPILVSHLPEGWTLPSYLTILAQFGNLGPVMFSLLIWLFPRTKLETPTCMVVLAVLSLCALFYAFFWERTVQVAGNSFSVAILILTMIQSMFAATSSMCYLGFMAHLKARYMSSIFIGQGLSGLIPAFVAIGQGTGEIRCVPDFNNVTKPLRVISLEVHNNTAFIHNETMGRTDNGTDVNLVHVNADPNITVRAFFLFLFAVGLLSLTSLLLLVYHPYCRTEHVDTDREENCQLMHSSNPEKEALSSQVATESAPTAKTGAKNNSDLDLVPPVVNYVESPRDPMHYEIDGEKTNGWHGRFDENSEKSRTIILDVMSQAETGNAEVAVDRASKTSLACRWVRNGDKGRQLDSHAHQGDAADAPSAGAEVAVVSEERHRESKGKQLTKRESWYLLGLLVWINVLQTSYVLAIQVYSSLPYGLAIYDGVTKTENIVDPVACFITLYVTAKTTSVISGLTLLGTLFIAYIITVAAMSPSPFLVHETMGGILVIAAWAMCTMFMVFSKVSIATVMRSQGRKSLMFAGASTQIGSLIGAVLAYCMINQLRLFHEGPWC